MNLRTLKLTLTYDGTRLVGWQRQAEGESVQGLLEEALAPLEGAPVTVHGAGRTDAGVHALAQVASVELTAAHDTSAILRGVNACLPGDIRVLHVEDAPEGFHARFSARSKTYRYILRNAPVVSPFERAYVWHVPEPLDLQAMREAAAALVGRHDFAAFQSAGSDVSATVRTMTRSEWVPAADLTLRLTQGHPEHGRGVTRSAPRDEGSLLAYEITGDGFLRHMVRAVVGTLVEIGQGRRPVSSAAALLAGGRRSEAGATAPPHGLFLVGVDYD